MKARPVWIAKEDMAWPPLRGPEQADVGVIGGGLCGVTTAYLLAKNGLRVTLLEAEQVGRGASFHTMGRVTAQHGLLYARLRDRFGAEVAKAYALTQQSALTDMEALVRELQISCLWTRQDASLIALNPEEERLLEQEAKASTEAGLAAALAPDGECPIPVCGLLTLPGQAMFDPSAYLACLAAAFVKLGGVIHEHSRVKAMDTQKAYTDTGALSAEFMVITTHFPIISFPGWYFLRAQQRRGNVLALGDTAGFSGMYQQVVPGGLSMVHHGGLTLLGGMDYRCGTQIHVAHGEMLLRWGEALFPGSRAVAAWQGQDVFSASGLPLIGAFSRRAPNFFVATGFSRWGMTGSMVAAKAICRKILGRPLMDLEIYDPARSSRRSVFPAMGIAARTSALYVAGLLKPTAPRCTHMGCKLRYVSSTGTWECPCHGSTFDGVGRIQNGPASRPARIRK